MTTVLGSNGSIHSLRAIGFSGVRWEEDLDHLSGQSGRLRSLEGGFRQAAGLGSDPAFAQAVISSIAPPMSVRRPGLRGSSRLRGYHRLPASFGESRTPPRSHLEASLRNDPFQRAQLEMLVGGRIVGVSQSTMQVQPFAPLGFGSRQNGAASVVSEMFDQMHRSSLGTGLMPLLDCAKSFIGMIVGGLLKILGKVGGPLAGHAILADPALTVEDKITLMLMEIMKQMDKQIEMQMMKIQMLQTQQGLIQAGSGAASMIPMFGGAGQIIGGIGQAVTPSVDVETMKLKRLTEKRNQMFDMLRQIVDKYNQTAKGLIDSMGR